MATEQERWIVVPAGRPAGAAKIVVGPEKMTPERQQALESLARNLEQDTTETMPIRCPIVSIQTCEILIICTGVEPV